jgi:hypothetical protein
MQVEYDSVETYATDGSGRGVGVLARMMEALASQGTGAAFFAMIKVEKRDPAGAESMTCVKSRMIGLL